MSGTNMIFSIKASKEEFATHVLPNRKCIEPGMISKEMDLFNALVCVDRMVARDRIELPTRGFSGTDMIVMINSSGCCTLS
jgi:hypothetical protein